MALDENCRDNKPLFDFVHAFNKGDISTRYRLLNTLIAEIKRNEEWAKDARLNTALRRIYNSTLDRQADKFPDNMITETTCPFRTLSATALAELRDERALISFFDNVRENSTFDDAKESLGLTEDREFSPKTLFRNKLLSLIGKYGDQGADTLCGLLRNTSEKPFIRASAALALGETGMKGAANTLNTVLSGSTDQEVRCGIVLALGKVGNEKSEEALMAILRDEGEDSDLRAYSAISLANLKCNAAIGTIQQLLVDEKEATFLRLCCALALGKLPGKDVCRTLGRTLNQNNTDEVLMRCIIVSLCNINQGGLEQYLAKFPLYDGNIDSDSVLTDPILQYLAENGFVGVFVDKYQGENSKYRRVIVSVCGFIRDPKALPTVIEFLENSTDPTDHILALGVISELDDNRAIPVLERFVLENRLDASGVEYARQLLMRLREKYFRPFIAWRR